MIRIFSPFILLLPALVSAQYNLQYFIESAFKNNSQINEYQNTVKSTGLEKELINAENDLPQISFSADYLLAPYLNNNGNFISTNPGLNAVGYDAGITNGGLYSALINAEKKIFNGPVINALNNQTDVLEQTAKNNIASAEHELEKQVTDQYLHTLLSLKQYRLESEALGYLKEEAEVATQLFDRGLLKQTDRLLLEIEIDNITIGLSNLHSEYRTNLNQLLTLCGIRDTAELMIDSVNLSMHPVMNNTFFEKKYELDSIAASNLQVISETKYLPQVSLFFNTGLNAVELTGIQRKFGFSAGINFLYPIYDGGQRSITRQQNELSLQNISFYKNSAHVLVENQRAIARTRIEIQMQNLERLHEQMKNYSTVVTISEQDLKQGLMSVVEYLTLLRNFIELKKNLAVAENGYLVEINNYNYWNW